MAPTSGGRNDARLVLHIGLPKTASTFLQYLIFKRAPDLIYVHRTRGRDEKKMGYLVRRYQRVEEAKVAATVAKANAALAGIYEKRGNRGRRTRGCPTLISQENISLGADGSWDFPKPTPSLLGTRVTTWARSDDLPHDSIGVILGVRRQDHWLASFYAESARNRGEDFGEADFEQRVRKLCDGALQGRWQWLDYGRAWRDLVNALGSEKVFVFPVEALAADPHDVLRQMGDFLGGVPLAEVYDRAAQDPEVKLRRNVKSVGPSTWKGKETDTTITLSEAVGDAIRQRFKSSNEELSEAIGVDLGPLGYW